MIIAIDAEAEILFSLPSGVVEEGADKKGLEERGHGGDWMREGRALRGVSGKGCPAALAVNETIR